MTMLMYTLLLSVPKHAGFCKWTQYHNYCVFLLINGTPVEMFLLIL